MRRQLFMMVYLACFLVMPMVAQERLTAAQINQMKRVGLDRINEFQKDMNFIMNPDNERYARLKTAWTHTKLFFINEEVDISVTDSRGVKRKKKLLVYLTAALGLEYTAVEVTFADIYCGNRLVYDERISKERGGNWYTVPVVYTQQFKGGRGKEAVFSDAVIRKTVVYIEKTQEVVDGEKIDTYHALLGDSDVTEIVYK